MATSIHQILNIIELENPDSIIWDRILKETLGIFGCTTGSIHILSRDSDLLHLKAHQGIPEFLLPKMAAIPIGKGMAGVAAQRMEPVQICNLQTDDSGIARPSAKDTKVEGAITIPILLGKTLYGTLGIAKSLPYDFSDEETTALMDLGAAIARKLEE